MSTQGKVVIVTGGASGIGRATAFAFAQQEAKVVVSDVDANGGQKTAQQIEETRGTALFVPCDVSQESEVETLVKTTVERFGRLDYAFNNAGIEGQQAHTAECSRQNWDRVIAINLTGVWLCMKYEIPQMLAQGGGAIVNMSSVAGLVGFEGLPAYVASKHGVAGLTRTAALEYGKAGIRINAVCPGVIWTPMVARVAGGGEEEAARTLGALEPIGRMGRPEEVAALVTWLCSDGAAFMLGSVIPVDGGFVAR